MQPGEQSPTREERLEDTATHFGQPDGDEEDALQPEDIAVVQAAWDLGDTHTTMDAVRIIKQGLFAMTISTVYVNILCGGYYSKP